MILLTILLLLSFMIFLLCISSYTYKKINIELKIFGLSSTILIFFCSLFLWLFFENINSIPQFLIFYPLLQNYNLNFMLGIDGYSIFLIILTTFTIPCCILINWYSKPKITKLYLF